MSFCATPKIWDFGGDSHFSAIMEVFMGNWGAGIFQNDISDDVKTDYKNKLKMGKSDEVALQEILSENSEFLDDAEDKFDFWFGLSSVMSDLGRLTEEVRNIAVGLIDRGGDVFRFEDDKSELKKRKAELEKLRNKLVGEQPERKRIPVVKAFLCPWKPNDILIYTLDSECFKDKPYFNKFIVLLVDEIVNYDVDIPLGDMLPITYLKICDDYPNSVEDINNSPFIPQRFIFYLNNPKKNKLEREHRFMWYRDGFKKQSSRFELWGNYEFTRPYNKPWTYPSIKDLRDFHTTIACMLNRFDEYIIESLDFYKDDL